MTRLPLLVPIALSLACSSVSDTGALDTDTGSETGASGPQLILIVDVDPTQERLDNFGQPAPDVPAGNAAQDPTFTLISTSHGELVPNAITALNAGTELFTTPEKQGAHEFDLVPTVAPGEEMISIPLDTLGTGTFEYLRLAVAYQHYTVIGHADFMGTDVEAAIQIASFLDDELYISSFDIGDETVTVDGVKTQGYFAAWSQFTGVVTGQVPAGQTTVPNPLDASSPIPVGSCVVTGTFGTPLTLTGDETEDIILRVTMSTNKAFEWNDLNDDGLWQPLSEPAADMGLRGMILEVE